MDGPTILVGHSYGGAVITEAGDHQKVVGLVYVEAFMPDVGESAFGLIPQDPNHPPPFDFSADGFAFFTEAAYVPGFADALPEADAEFMRDQPGADLARRVPAAAADRRRLEDEADLVPDGRCGPCDPA